MVKEDRLKNLLSHKSLLILIKYIPHIIAIAYAIYTFLGIFGIDYNIFGCFFHVSFLTWMVLYCLSIVFKYCYVHRLPIYYIGANELITCLDYYLDIELDYFTFITISLLMSCILIFGYTYYYINKLKMRDKKKFYVPKHIKKPLPGDYEVTLNWGDKVYVEKNEFEKKTGKFFKNYLVVEGDNNKTVNANGHVYVDLGLPSGTLWATMNIGNNPDDDFFYNRGNSFFYANTDADPQSGNIYMTGDGYGNPIYSKYTSLDNLTELELSDDAAHVLWGGDWRVPTIEQVKELFTYTYWNGGGNLKSLINGNSITMYMIDSYYLTANLYKDDTIYTYSSYYDLYWTTNRRTKSGYIRPVISSNLSNLLKPQFNTYEINLDINYQDEYDNVYTNPYNFIKYLLKWINRSLLDLLNDALSKNDSDTTAVLLNYEQFTLEILRDDYGYAAIVTTDYSDDLYPYGNGGCSKLQFNYDYDENDNIISATLTLYLDNDVEYTFTYAAIDGYISINRTAQ